MTVTTRIEWTDGVSFRATTGSGHEIIMDGAPEVGGQNAGGRPMEMVLTGLAGCASVNVVEILKKMRQPLIGVAADLTAERAETAPKVFTKIHMAYTITGKGVELSKAENAVSLSVEKYCSAVEMLNKTAEITYSVAVEDVD